MSRIVFGIIFLISVQIFNLATEINPAQILQYLYFDKRITKMIFLLAKRGRRIGAPLWAKRFAMA